MTRDGDGRATDRKGGVLLLQEFLLLQRLVAAASGSRGGGRSTPQESTEEVADGARSAQDDRVLGSREEGELFRRRGIAIREGVDWRRGGAAQAAGEGEGEEEQECWTHLQ